jgi:hypothetical protein
MTAREIYDLALSGGGNDFQATVELLKRLDLPWCLIGGLAVNAYAEPVYTADADFADFYDLLNFYGAIVLVTIVLIRVVIAWIINQRDGFYRQWLKQRRDERRAVEKERVRLQYLSPKAFAQLVADLPSIHCSVENLLEMAERELPKGNPQFFWDMISKLGGILSDGIPDKVWAIKKQAGVGRACEREQAETLEQEAKRFAERMQSLVARAKGLETFAQEHAVRCAYEERELEDLKRLNDLFRGDD